MAKKNAAPYKGARKASAGKKAPPKKVAAPLRHKPKGSAKERLAYLNKDEMAALEKRKGSPARRGPKGLPSFADDSASSKGVSRGDSSGTKGSGSTKTSTGSVSKSTESKSSPSGAGPSAGRGQGGQGYNSGTSGSRSGGASTQKPGMGRNSGRVGPQSPMAGQGTSFATNKAARDDTLSRAYGIDDRRGRMGPYRGEFDSGLSRDQEGNMFNQNNPEKLRDRLDNMDREEAFRKSNDDRFYRSMAKTNLGPQTNPREMREYVGRMNAMAANARSQMDSEAVRRQKGDPSYSVNSTRNSISTPDVRVGPSGRGFAGGKGNLGGGYRSGGAVKSFKKK